MSGSFRYTPEMVDCRYCTEYVKKQHGCRAKFCPWLEERIEAGVIGYYEAIWESRMLESPVRDRIRVLIEQFPNSFWVNKNHYLRMNYLRALHSYSKQRDTPNWYASLYLLSSTSELCGRTINCVRRDGIEFSYAKLRNISTSDYALFMASKTIYTGELKITLDDLSDIEIIDDETFKLIINAQLISRYGPAILEVKEKRIQGRGAI